MSDAITKSVGITVTKIDTDRRLVTAITNVVSDGQGNLLVDHDGDVITEDNLEEAFIDAFADGGKDMGGVMHKARGGVDVVQHFVFTQKDWSSISTFLDKDFGAMPGFGIVKFKVHDDSIWADVKAGRFPEVSIEADGVRKPM